MPMTPRELIVLLKHNGFEEVSQNGSHVKMKNFQIKIYGYGQDFYLTKTCKTKKC